MFNSKFMLMALEIAKKAKLDGEVPVGSLIVNPDNKKIIAKASNYVERRCDPTAHAEIIAIQSACSSLSTKSLYGLDLYVTLQPCIMCMQAILYSKVRRLYFGASNPNISFDIKSSNATLEVYGGIEEEKCKLLLNSFFIEKRI